MDTRINNLVKLVRKESGSTQIRFAEELGASQAALSKIENGLMKVSAGVLAGLYKFVCNEDILSVIKRKL